MDNPKFIKDQKPLTDSEIEKNMDFDAVLRGASSSGGWLSKLSSGAKLSAGIASIVIIAFFGYNISKKGKENAGSESAFINPPLKELNVENEKVLIPTNRDSILHFKNGSSVYIPASSFVDEKGTVIKGDVEFQYREFHNPVDIFLSGIPMNYDSGGLSYSFESAGMFECRAFKDGKPVFLRPGKELEVSLISKTASNSFNRYFLNEEKREWEYIGANSVENNTNTPLYTNATVREYEEEVNKNYEPVIPQVADNKSNTLSIDYKKEEFPELEVFENIKFSIEDSNFQPEHATETWDEVSLAKQSDVDYSINFSKGEDQVSYKVKPVLSRKEYRKAKRKFEKKRKQYWSKLFKRKSEKKYAEAVLKHKYSQQKRVAEWSNVNKKVNTFVKQQRVNYGALAIRTFRVPALGVWNADKVMMPLSRFPVIKEGLTFSSEKESVLTPLSVYFIPIDRNGVYRLPQQKGVYKKFPYDPKKFFHTLVVTKEGKLGKIDWAEYASTITDEEDHTLEVVVSDKKFSDAGSLQKFIGNE